jgi:hypothetical protein
VCAGAAAVDVPPSPNAHEREAMVPSASVLVSENEQFRSVQLEVKLATGADASTKPVLKLKGDASNRSYYRVGSAPDSHVLMVMPKDAAIKSEEATKGAAPTELPFLNVHRYLTGLGIRVRAIVQRPVLTGWDQLGVRNRPHPAAARLVGRKHHARSLKIEVGT